jgi:hypothetical protein
MPSKPIIRDIDKGWKRVKFETAEGVQYVAVGIFGAKASADHGGLPNIKVATAHEFGVTIQHPGGTAYIIRDGQAVFISNEAAVGRDLPRTQPHEIVIPERSFIRKTVDIKRRQIVALSKNLAAKVLDGSQTREKALAMIGVFTQGEIRARMSRGIPPPLKPATVARKGSSKPLIDTGQLRASVDSEVRGKKKQ